MTGAWLEAVGLGSCIEGRGLSSDAGITPPSSSLASMTASGLFLQGFLRPLHHLARQS